MHNICIYIFIYIFKGKYETHALCKINNALCKIKCKIKNIFLESFNYKI